MANKPENGYTPINRLTGAFKSLGTGIVAATLSAGLALGFYAPKAEAHTDAQTVQQDEKFYAQEQKAFEDEEWNTNGAVTEETVGRYTDYANARHRNFSHAQFMKNIQLLNRALGGAEGRAPDTNIWGAENPDVQVSADYVYFTVVAGTSLEDAVKYAVTGYDPRYTEKNVLQREAFTGLDHDTQEEVIEAAEEAMEAQGPSNVEFYTRIRTEDTLVAVRPEVVLSMVDAANGYTNLPADFPPAIEPTDHKKKETAPEQKKEETPEPAQPPKATPPPQTTADPCDPANFNKKIAKYRAEVKEDIEDANRVFVFYNDGVLAIEKEWKADTAKYRKCDKLKDALEKNDAEVDKELQALTEDQYNTTRARDFTALARFGGNGAANPWYKGGADISFRFHNVPEDLDLRVFGTGTGFYRGDGEEDGIQLRTGEGGAAVDAEKGLGKRNKFRLQVSGWGKRRVEETSYSNTNNTNETGPIPDGTQTSTGTEQSDGYTKSDGTEKVTIAAELGGDIDFDSFVLRLFGGGMFFYQPSDTRFADVTNSNGTVDTHTEQAGPPASTVDSTTTYDVTATTDGRVKYNVTGGGFNLGLIFRELKLGKGVKMFVGPQLQYTTAAGEDNGSESSTTVDQTDQTDTTVAIDGLDPWTDSGPTNHSRNTTDNDIALRSYRQHNVKPAAKIGFESKNTYTELVIGFPVSNQSEDAEDNAEGNFQLVDYRPDVQVLGLYRAGITFGINARFNNENLGARFIFSGKKNLEALAQHHSYVNNMQMMGLMASELQAPYLRNLEQRTLVLDVEGLVIEPFVYGDRNGTFDNAGALVAFSWNNPKFWGGLIGEASYVNSDESARFRATAVFGLTDHLGIMLYGEGDSHSEALPGNGFEWQAGIGLLGRFDTLPPGYTRYHPEAAQEPAAADAEQAIPLADETAAGAYAAGATTESSASAEAGLNVGEDKKQEAQPEPAAAPAEPEAAPAATEDKDASKEDKPAAAEEKPKKGKKGKKK